MYPSTSSIHPLTIATVNPTKRRESAACRMKPHSEREKRARRAEFVVREGL